VCLFACSNGSQTARGSHDVAIKLIALCDVPTAGKDSIGHIVAVRGELIQEIEWTGLEDRLCPDTVIGLGPSVNGPTAAECTLNEATANCGGLKRDGQIVTVVGILRRAEVSAKGKLPSRIGYIDVIRFEAAADRQSQNGT